jgi:hypothetical protein
MNTSTLSVLSGEFTRRSEWNMCGVAHTNCGYFYFQIKKNIYKKMHRQCPSGLELWVTAFQNSGAIYDKMKERRHE